ncbi:MAG: hypothetical protein WBD31_07200, partial [Rubripirellula sp.]
MMSSAADDRSDEPCVGPKQRIGRFEMETTKALLGQRGRYAFNVKNPRGFTNGTQCEFDATEFSLCLEHLLNHTICRFRDGR